MLRCGRRRRRLLLLLLLLLPGLLLGAAPAEAGGAPGEASRPYEVLRSQNLVLMGSVFSVLLVAVILMAVCVYKPVRRR